MRCEGWRRKGGAFTLGPVTWKQCHEEAIIELVVDQKGETTASFPACQICWDECTKSRDVIVRSALPLAKGEN